MTKIGFCGTGQFGFAMLKHLERKFAADRSVELSAFDADAPLLESLKSQRTHLYIQGPDNTITEKIHMLASVDALISTADILVLAVNGAALTDVFASIRSQNKQGLKLVNLAKAMDNSFRTFSMVAAEALKGIEYTFSTLVGGSLAEDLLKANPLGMSLACADETVRNELIAVFENGYLKVYPETDLVGVELAAALKNPISLVAGITEGLGFAYGTVTYMIVSAAKEIAQMAQSNFGVKPETFDMYTMHWGDDMWMSATGASRNRKFGELIGQGKTEEEAFTELKTKTVESLFTLQGMAQAKDFEKSPIMSMIYKIFVAKTEPANAFKDFILNNKF